LDPEKAHDLTCDFLGFAETIPFARQVIKRFYQFESPSISLFGLNFPNCIGLAAGLDKNAMFSSISSSLGFGHVEVGTLTPNAQPGNPQPRLFRYPESEALVNRMGFNNHGAIAAVERLRKYNPKGKRLSPVGINIGKGKETPPEEAIEDYLHGFKIVSTQADFITINISSPNTPGLRLLHQKSFLDPLLEEVQKLNKSLASKNSSKLIPCLLKISPDEDFKGLESIISSALDYEIDGLIATNTTTSRKNSDFEMGGLSGKPLEERSLQSIKFIVKESENKIPVIGVGGIHDTESANKKLDAGSSLLQLYTSLIYKGPSFPSQLASSLNSRFAWL
jgi:dihydroorotate dehydrogenase